VGESSEMRISDTEREDAVRMLGEHMSVGRLDVEEYGERTAKATAAKTQGELTSLFTDLPEPKPTFTPVAPPAPRPAATPARQDERPLAQRLWSAAVPLSALVALILFLTVFKVWFIFLLPAAVAVIGGALWGEDHRAQQRRMHRRRMHRGWHD
jgi:hypothetical protein